ncbi:UFL1 [Acanthosepion pharaonis]|uniref:UFL1 n=1 Tax=Acanthosepion pharaonis TaxID=158019 RepID=A0A812AVK2_ACAPH|nr:UFL1 [Sepia pharaonis]
MADWLDVQRLRAEFEAVQQKSSLQKLSERNVIEIVSKLVELKLTNVIYTLDGKEYLTWQQLEKEILEELYINGGRVNLADLKQALNVDYSHIEAKVNDITRHNHDVTLLLGQLFNKSYKTRIAEEINEKLQENGHLLIIDLIQQYDLPPNFLLSIIQQNIGSVIKGKMDNINKDVIYTDLFISRMRAKIRGLFSAMTRPTSMYNICKQHGFKENMFCTIVEELLKSHRISGTLIGQKEKGIYHPENYVKTQNKWVEDFYNQNDYLEYDTLSRLGIGDPKDFIKRKFKNEPLTFLSTCCIGASLKEQVEASVDEALSNGTWIDILSYLPSVITIEDASQLLSSIVSKHKEAFQCCDTIIASNKLICECKKPFTEMMKTKAAKESKSNSAVFKAEKKSGNNRNFDEGREDKKENRKKKGGGGSTKSGGGSQGREIKSRSTKKKYRVSHEDDSDDEAMDGGKAQLKKLHFMDIEEIEEVIRKEEKLIDSPDELVTEIATQLYKPLTQEYQEIAKSIFFETSGSATGAGRKKNFTEVQDKVCGLWSNMLLIEKGIKYFPEATQTQLVKHLLKTICTDITNLIVTTVANEHMLSIPDEIQLTPETRANVIQKFPEPSQSLLKKLNASLNKNLGEFSTHLNTVCSPENLGIMLRKPDRKKEKQLLTEHRQTLIVELSSESDPAAALHLASMILFQTFTNSFVHAPGRCVPKIIDFLAEHMSPLSHEVLRIFQDLVIKDIKLQGEDKEESSDKSEYQRALQELLPKLQEIAVMTKIKDKEKSPESP